jgi:hypothetical protein
MEEWNGGKSDFALAVEVRLIHRCQRSVQFHTVPRILSTGGITHFAEQCAGLKAGSVHFN